MSNSGISGQDSSFLAARTEHPKQFLDRVIIAVHHALLQWNDRVIRDGDVLGADLGAAFGDVAVADALGFLELRQAILGIEGMHFEGGTVDEESRPDEFVMLVVIAQHVTNILAQETFDALAEFLDAIHVGLRHPPCAVGVIRLARLEFPDPFFDREIPGDVGDQIADGGKRLHGFDGHRLGEIQLVEAGHAHELRFAVDLGRAGTALAGLAVPAAGQVVGLGGLDLVDGIEDDHAFGDLRLVIDHFAAGRVSAPDGERRRLGRGIHGYFISSIIALSSAGISFTGSRRIFISPPGLQ